MYRWCRRLAQAFCEGPSLRSEKVTWVHQSEFYLHIYNTMTAYYNASDTWMIFRAVLNNFILQLDWNAFSKPMFILLFISNGCESDCFFLSVFRESLWKASLEIIIWCPSCQWMRKKGKVLQLKNLPPSSVLYAASLIHAICHHNWSICSLFKFREREGMVDTTTRLTTWTTGYGLWWTV